jgi:thiol:disulfide interchange protein DsbD
MRHCIHKYNIFLGLLWVLCWQVAVATASPTDPLSSLSVPKVLTIDAAFNFNLQHEQTTLRAEWQIAPSCYLYKEQIRINLVQPNGDEVSLIRPQDLPPAKEINDPYFGTQGIYHQLVVIPVSLDNVIKDIVQKNLVIQVHYQGCAESGFCYPPTTKWYDIKIANRQIVEVSPLEKSPYAAQAPAQVTAEPATNAPSKFRLSLPQMPNVAELQAGNHFLAILATFYVFGILLTFTPCVLPMIPILLGVIVGQKHLNTRKAFWLSLSYVLSMAVTYAIGGIVAATLGKNLQAYLQQPGFIISFAALFVILALMQLNILRFNLPHALRLKDILTKIHAKQESGTYIGAAVMGVLATLISSPCVSLPLIGALSIISSTGNILLGGSALLALGLGMGTIMLAIGTLGGKYFPKSGPWMHHVNQIFAVIMFGICLWLLDRLYHGPWLLVLWGVLCLFAAWCLRSFTTRSGWNGRFGIVFVIYAIILFWGALLGEEDPLKPLAYNPWKSANQVTTAAPLNYQTINSIAGLATVQEKARKQDRPLLVIFFADWCISCKHIEHEVLTDPEVQKHLAAWDLVKADVTSNSEANQLLLKKFGLIGPPAILFFAKDGSELITFRVIGETNAASFNDHLLQLRRELKLSS